MDPTHRGVLFNKLSNGHKIDDIVVHIPPMEFASLPFAFFFMYLSL